MNARPGLTEVYSQFCKREFQYCIGKKLGIYQYFGNQGVDLDLTAFFKITLLSVTRDEYLYQKSLITYSNSSNSLFAEPTLLHTNMDNGLGVFSMMSADTIEEEFEY